MKKMTIFLIGVMCLSAIAAQPKDGKNFEEKREQMEMMVMWKLTEQLKLTEDQAEKFFPVFRQHRDEMKAIRDEQRAITSELGEKVDRGDVISDEEIKQEMEKLKVLELKRIEAREALFHKMEGTLNNAQRFKLLGMEHQMRNEMKKEIRKHRGKRMKEHRGRKGFWN